jgi:hypothetical protein
VHLVLADPRSRKQMMVVEFPAYSRTVGASRVARRARHRARTRLVAACGHPGDSFSALHGSATISGVGLWDLRHGQRGLAPNGIELHPAVGFRLRSASC